MAASGQWNLNSEIIFAGEDKLNQVMLQRAEPCLSPHVGLVVGEAPPTSAFSLGRGTQGCEPNARVFPNLRRMHKYRNRPLSKQLSFDFLTSFLFCGKQIFPWERGHIENWGVPPTYRP
jgi:hypothetical protein